MKLRNKLILSCAALAAVATTAVSTTYAWYTSNQEVTADGITASTSSSSDALLLISKTGLANSWSSHVEFNDHAAVTLVPLYRDGDGKFYRWAADSNATAEDETSIATDYYGFSLYFKSGNGNPLTVSYKTFTLTNTTSALPTKSVLTNTGLPSAATSNSTYSVNFVKALTMEIEYSNTVEATTGTQAPHGDTTAKASYGFTTEIGVTTAKADTVASNSVNAHQYYNAVKQLETGIDTTKDGSPAKRSETRTQVSALADFNADFNAAAYKIGGTAGTESTNILRVDYVIYLDGWDYHCFDACQSQTFTLAMDFKSTAA